MCTQVWRTAPVPAHAQQRPIAAEAPLLPHPSTARWHAVSHSALLWPMSSFRVLTGAPNAVFIPLHWGLAWWQAQAQASLQAAMRAGRRVLGGAAERPVAASSSGSAAVSAGYDWDIFTTVMARLGLEYHDVERIRWACKFCGSHWGQVSLVVLQQLVLVLVLVVRFTAPSA